MTRVSFESIAIEDNNEKLVDLSGYPFVLDTSYYNQGFSTSEKMSLREGVANKLAEIQSVFDGKYRFKIWDGHRPRSVQDAIYNDYYERLKTNNPDWDEAAVHHATEQFVTKATTQKRIPPHSTGGAVDLTLVDHEGRELNMGTIFDFFGPEAAALYYEENELDEEVRNNRRILREAMLAGGFAADDDEWWHFDYGNQLWALRSKSPSAVYGEASLI
jgi:D-alanyl-D-alanine dipeptidase